MSCKIKKPNKLKPKVNIRVYLFGTSGEEVMIKILKGNNKVYKFKLTVGRTVAYSGGMGSYMIQATGSPCLQTCPGKTTKCKKEGYCGLITAINSTSFFFPGTISMSKQVYFNVTCGKCN